MGRLLIPRRSLLLAAPALLLSRPSRAFWQSRDSNYDANVVSGGGGSGGGGPLIAHTAQASTNTNGFTTSTGIDTTGANFIVVGMLWYTPGGTPSITDSKSNGAPTALTGFAGASDGVRFFYWYNPATVGSGHTFTCSGTGNYPTMFVAAFSTASASPFDAEQTGNTAAGTLLSCGLAVTPSVNNELVLSIMSTANSGSGFSVDGGFTIIDTITGAGGYEGGLAYLKQTTAATTNPTWSWITSTRGVTNLAAFKFT